MTNQTSIENKIKDVWILDDDASICEALKIVLTDSGYNAEVFNASAELKEKLKTHHPNLLIMDILLNNENGTEIAKKLKSNKKYASIPIILMSANNTDKKMLLTSKADSFIKKPFDIYSLIREVALII